MADEATVELGNFIAALRQADLVNLRWGDQKMLCGNQRSMNPKILTLLVADEADARIINRAKEAVSRGEEEVAYTILAEITEERAQH
jgi:hypothetical protein